MKKQLTKWILSGALMAFVALPALEAQDLVVPLLTEAPTIDGIANDAVWSTMDSVPIAVVADGKTAPDGDAASFKAGWLSDTLYLVIEIQDESPVWNDWIAVYLDFDNQKTATYVDDTQVYWEQSIEGWHNKSRFGPDWKPIVDAELINKIVSADGLTVAEYAIPVGEWGRIGTSRNLGMEIAITDQDSEVTQDVKYQWHQSKTGVYENPSLFGTLELPESANKSKPVAAFTMNKSVGFTPLVVTFDARGTKDPQGDETIASYSWDFGDGADVVTGDSVNHTYTTAGEFTVTLTVTDEDGNFSTLTKKVTATDLVCAGTAPANLMVPEVETAPTIDGVVGSSEAWSSATYQDILIPAEGSTAEGDLSAKFKTIMSGNSLFVLVEVFDDELDFSHEQPWNRDGGAIFLDLNNEGGDPVAYNGDDLWIRWTWGTEHFDGRWGAGQFSDAAFLPDSTINWAQTSDKVPYVMEVEIPLSKWGLACTPEAGVQFGFDIEIMDADSQTDGVAGRQSDIFWYSGNGETELTGGNWNDASLHGILELEGAAGTLDAQVPELLNLIYPNPARDFVIVSKEINKVEIYSLQGKLVQKTSQITQEKVNVSSLGEGMYLIKSWDLSGNTKVSRLLIQR